MLLTTKQAAEKLKIHPTTLAMNVRKGKITAANTPAKGKKRTVWMFDSKYINSLIKEGKTPKSRARTSSNPIGKLENLTRALARIEYKVDTLIAMWE